MYLEKVCPDPNVDIPNGQVTFVHNGTIPAGAVANYSCDEGYVMVGPDNKECKEEEGWGPAVEVLCVKNE